MIIGDLIRGRGLIIEGQTGDLEENLQAEKKRPEKERWKEKVRQGV